MSSAKKLHWLNSNTILTTKTNEIIPTNDGIWLDQTNNDFESLMPLISKHGKSLFHVMTTGVSTAKDDWTYDFDKSNLRKKMKYYISTYNKILKNNIDFERIINIENASKLTDEIKWSQTTINGIKNKQQINYSIDNIKPTLYRPFVVKNQYYDNVITHDMRDFRQFFKNSQPNK